MPPRRVAAATAPWPLFDVAATRLREQRGLAATPPHTLMGRAGLAVARLALALGPHARRIGVLAGPGNNGGDGLIAALALQRWGHDVRVLHLADPARLPDDAADALQQARAAALPFVPRADDLAEADLLIDALLGLGASRAPAGPLAEAIAWANAWASTSGRPLLAVDLPSGLDGESGRVLGDAAIRARWTLSLMTLKPGLFTGQGRDHAGEVWLDDLALPDDPRPEAAPCAWLGTQPPAGAFGARRHAQHKGSFGDLVVVGGAPGMAGAAGLAARAALTAGAGRVYLSPLDPAAAPPPWPELMQRPQAWAAGGAELARATVVAGCGGGALVAAALPALITHAARLVLDADALNALAADAALAQALAARRPRGQFTLLTPHPLEAARLLGTGTDAVQADRLGAARGLAERLGAVVVLKGSGTVVAATGRQPWINASGNARLAAPGSGDVLAGWLGGHWAAQGAATEADALAAAQAVVWLHGHAADRANAPGLAHLPLRAGDLVDAMAAALRA